MPYTTANGARFWYEVIGDAGEPMVLLGGSGLGRQNLDPVIPHLKHKFTLLNFDQRGFGRSDREGIATATFALWADDVVALMDAIGWERAHLQGTSHGCRVAFAAAIRHPDRCTSIILNNFFAKPDVRHKLVFEVEAELSRLVHGSHAAAAHIAHTYLTPNYLDTHPDAVDAILVPLKQVPSGTWLRMLELMRDMDFTGELHKCRVPTLCITGDRATILDLEPSGMGVRRTAELIPDAELVLLEGSGHLTVFEATERHVEAVLAFTESLSQD